MLRRLALVLPCITLAIACGESDKAENEPENPASEQEDGDGGSDAPAEPADEDGDGVAAGVDCDDTDPAVLPGAAELCDGIDNNCDGVVDEDALDRTVFYADADGDGVGDAAVEVEACEAPAGHVAAAGDCDDADPAAHPGAEEDCSIPVDRNCDGELEYEDADGDGFAACTECDDADPAVHPDAEERCDTIDNDCDGAVDEDDAVDAATWHRDADEDGFGDPAEVHVSCAAPAGFLADATDCDDAEALTHPGATEHCDGIDQDCDGVDDNPGTATFVDAAGDITDMSAAMTGTVDLPAEVQLSDPGTLQICEGTWYAHLDLLEDVSVVGLYGAETTIVDGGGRGTVLSVSAEFSTVDISELTITGGAGDSTVEGSSLAAGGGLVCNAEATLSVSDVVFEGNTAENGAGAAISNDCVASFTDVQFSNGSSTYGGAVTSIYSEVSFDSVDFTDNSASNTNGGGALRISDAAAVGLVDGLLSGNTCQNGGAIYNNGGLLDIEGTAFEENVAGADGGAISNLGVLTIDGASFSDNTAGTNGGAINDEGTSMSIDNTSFSSNIADSYGGAIFQGATTASIDNSTFTANEAAYGGAVLQYSSSALTIDASSFSANMATKYGGAVYAVGDELSVDSSTFDANDAGLYGGALRINGTDVTLDTVTFTNNASDGAGGGIAIISSSSSLLGSVVSFSANTPDDVYTSSGGAETYTSTTSLDCSSSGCD